MPHLNKAPAPSTGRRKAYVYEEDLFQKEVLRVAKLCQWEPFFVQDSRGSPPGWPDLVLLKVPRILFVELKSAKGVLSPAQKWWTTQLQQLGVFFDLYTKANECPQGVRPSMETYIWHAPGNWTQIGQILGVNGV